LGALVGAFSMLEAGLSISRRISQSVLGQAVTRDEEPELWGLVESVAQRLGSLQPKNIVIGLEPNFYATSADVVVRPGQITHPDETLYLSLPLMRTLSREELTAVIGHELAHFRGEDTRFSLEFYPIYAGTARALEALHNETRAGARGLAMMPGIAILSFFIEQFATAERGLGRARELEADQAGASVSSPAALATALLKIGAFTRLWNPAVAEMIETLRDNQPVTNISSRYAELAALSGSTEIIEDVAAAKTAHPTDTHPPTGVRIEALGLSVAELDEIALNIDPHTSSIELLADPVALEEKLTEAARRLLVERGVVPALKLSQGNVDSAPAPTQAAEHAEA
jgi:Zn-dependent protease with chaperone function